MIGFNKRRLARRAFVGTRCMRKGSSSPTRKESHALDVEFALAVWPECRLVAVSNIAVGASRMCGRLDLPATFACSALPMRRTAPTSNHDLCARATLKRSARPSDAEKSNFSAATTSAWSSRPSSLSIERRITPQTKSDSSA